MIDQLIQLVYLVATALFIFSLKWMSDPLTARRGVFAGVGGMALAIIGTLLHPLIIGYSWIAIPLVLGALAGVPLSWVPLTAPSAASPRVWSEPRSISCGPNTTS
jgi:NAD(P) transhydrogenase subunit beta